jgi:hypothetical protein
VLDVVANRYLILICFVYDGCSLLLFMFSGDLGVSSAEAMLW